MGEFVCECGAKKGSEAALKSHICIKHLQWMPYECSHCSANHEHTREATEQDLLLHTNEIHPGQELRYSFFGDSHKQQSLNRKIERSKYPAIDQNNPTGSPSISIAPTEVGAKTEVITIDEEEDYKPQSPPVEHHLSDHVQAAANTQSTNDVTPSAHQAPPAVETIGLQVKHPAVNSPLNQQSKVAGVGGDSNQLIEADEQEEMKPKPNYDSDDSGDDFEPSTPPSKSPIPEPEVKPELIVGDDDDFKPDPPASNMRDSQSQQQHVGDGAPEEAKDAMDSDDSDGSSPQQTPIAATKRNKFKRNKKIRKAQGSPKHLMKSKSTNVPGTGYCVTCKRHFASICRHLSAKLSSPVFKCSKCTYRSKPAHCILKHIKSGTCGRVAKAVRIRSKVDVATEMRKLRQIHLGAAPRDWPYRCTECKIGIAKVSYHILKHHLKVEQYECPVCGLSGWWRAIQTHMQKKHKESQTQPIWNQTKFREQIREIQDAVIVSNK